jgi:hypothetical protein
VVCLSTSQWKIILLAGIVGAVLGLANFLKPVYTATLSFFFALKMKIGWWIGSALFSQFTGFRAVVAEVPYRINLTELFKSFYGGTNLLSPVLGRRQDYFSGRNVHSKSRMAENGMNLNIKIFNFYQI